MNFITIQLLYAVSYGSLLFMLACGMSLIFGLMKITNMAHVAFFSIGLYMGAIISKLTGSFVLAIISTVLVVGVIGYLLFRFMLGRMYRFPLGQVLVGMGIMFFAADALQVVFGVQPQRMPTPVWLSASIPIFNQSFPVYRLFLILVGIVVIAGLNLWVTKTRIGALVRSGVDDAETTEAMGVNIYKLFSIVYVVGTVLAGIGGVVGGPLVAMEPNILFTFMPISLAISILGGLGNLKGAYFASLIVGAIDTFGRVFFPEFSYFTIFVPMAIICVVKPEGLFATSEKSLTKKAVKNRLKGVTPQ